MIALARSMPELVVRVNSLDADPWLLNVQNGTVDLRTGELRPHNRADLITKLAPTRYDPAAECPRFVAFLDRIFASDADLISFVDRWLGYSLTGDISEQLLPVCYGVGNNGKSVLLDTVVGLMGDYASPAPPHLVEESRQREHACEIADLCGRRLVIASETEQGSGAEAATGQAPDGRRAAQGAVYAAGLLHVPGALTS
jgi:putative DNA primase/helicase